MKRISAFVLVCLVLQVATAQPGKSPEAMIKQFYTGYITTIANDQPKDSERKVKALEKKYCTQKLIDRLPELIAASGADPILEAQDSNTDILKTLSVKRNLKKPNEYTVSYSFTDPEVKPDLKVNIYLTLVNRNGAYQIDNVR